MSCSLLTILKKIGKSGFMGKKQMWSRMVIEHRSQIFWIHLLFLTLLVPEARGLSQSNLDNST